jgi:hypothetical protein
MSRTSFPYPLDDVSSDIASTRILSVDGLIFRETAKPIYPSRKRLVHEESAFTN